MMPSVLRRFLIAAAAIAAAAQTVSAQTLPNAPGAPTVTTGLGAITVTWPAPTAGDTPTAYRLEFYFVSPRSLAGIFLTGTERVFSAAVPNGTCTVSVAAINAAGTGPASAETTFTVGPGALQVPATPIDLRAEVIGQQVTLTWNMPATSAATTSHWIELGTASGTSTLGVFDTVSSQRRTTTSMLPGLYFARVRARNAAGVSAASAEVSFLVVP